MTATPPAVEPDYCAPFYRRRIDVDGTFWGGLTMVEVEGPAPGAPLVFVGDDDGWRWWRGYYGHGGTDPAPRWAQRVRPTATATGDA